MCQPHHYWKGCVWRGQQERANSDWTLGRPDSGWHKEEHWMWLCRFAKTHANAADHNLKCGIDICPRLYVFISTTWDFIERTSVVRIVYLTSSFLLVFPNILCFMQSYRLCSLKACCAILMKNRKKKYIWLSYLFYKRWEGCFYNWCSHWTSFHPLWYVHELVCSLYQDGPRGRLLLMCFRSWLNLDVEKRKEWRRKITPPHTHMLLRVHPRQPCTIPER